MFNKNNQEVNIELYKEVEIEVYRSKHKNIRDNELIMLITPSQNLFKVILWKKNKRKVFSDLIKAQEYIKKKSLNN